MTESMYLVKLNLKGLVMLEIILKRYKNSDGGIPSEYKFIDSVLDAIEKLYDSHQDS